ncbi:MAG TPA: tripartite tricarboxylate transporter substrate binding protein [Burkholderiales bacterium]|jgi:tripartite-type tricarboxylate transporter receptor subunit TctC|nr:tripartite tricarboxylate transporter substrate binding protein [Burkholderiales bacterium]
MGKLILASCVVLAASAAGAQEYPAREIRSICNFAPGSGADIIVRYYSEQLAKLAGKPVVVENKPGAQGSIASAFVAKSAPDGYTIHITPASSTLAAAPHIFKQLPFDPIKDFASVTTINSLTFVVAVDAAKPIKSIQELIQALRQKPGHGFYGTQSNSGQIAAELLKANTGLNTVYVPFKVTGDAFTNLLSGQIDFMSVDSTWAKSQPKVRILAVTAAKRSSTMPEIPTLAEAGVPGVDVAPWWGVVVPAGTPRPIVDKLAGWFNQITASDETRQFLARAALDPFPGSPEQMAGLLKSEVERWGGFVKLAKIQPQ